MSWERFVVNHHERLLLTNNGRFERILVPGEYHVLVADSLTLEFEKHSLSNPVFRSKWSEYLVRYRPEVIDHHFTRIETTETQIAMVYLNGELFQVLVPAKRLLVWRDAAVVTAEFTDVVADAEPPSELLEIAAKKMARC